MIRSGDRIDFLAQPEALQISNLVWLPDSKGAIYMQTDNLNASTFSTITYIDLETLEQSIILNTSE